VFGSVATHTYIHIHEANKTHACGVCGHVYIEEPAQGGGVDLADARCCVGVPRMKAEATGSDVRVTNNE
jgi:hypothetical protein